MKISELFPDPGRSIAYIPKLRKIAGSINAALLLCQLIYWHGKQRDPDGWIFKRAWRGNEELDGQSSLETQDLQSETGLSYRELLNARRALRQRRLIHERYDRLNHTLSFKVDLDALQRAWLNAGEHLPKAQVALTDSASGTYPKRKSLNGAYIDYTQTTSEMTPTPADATNADRHVPASPLEALQHPMIQQFQQVCGRVPGHRDYALVIDLMRHLESRHGQGTVEYLRGFWLAWRSRKRRSDGRPYDPGSLTWLSEWAMNGEIPAEYGGTHDRTATQGTFARRHGPPQGGTTGPKAVARLSAADEGAARRINHRRGRKVSHLP